LLQGGGGVNLQPPWLRHWHHSKFIASFYSLIHFTFTADEQMLRQHVCHQGWHT